jgi:hypothetical protein
MATTINTADLELGGIGEYRTGAFSPKEVRLISSTNLFRVSKDGSVSVNDITLTVQRVYVTGSATFTTSPTVTLTGTGDTRTLSYANMGANNTVVVTVSVTDSADNTVYTDTVTLAKVTDGSDSLTVVLSNEACSVPGNALGQAASLAGTGTTIEVYEGSQKLTYVTGTLTNSSFSVTTAVSPVAKLTVGTITGANTTTATVPNHSALADDTDLVTVTYTVTAKRSNGTNSTLVATQSITKTRNGLNFSDAKVLFTDTTFATGLNSAQVYNNSGGGTVTVTREAAQADSPFINVSSFNLKITNTGTASPGIGGFVHVTTSRANAIFAQRIIAKIPVGYTLQLASNSIGDNSTQRWITSQAGTGNFEEYIVIRKCGATGTFSTTGHLYLTGTVGTPAAPVNWYLAYATVYDFTAPANLLTSARLTRDSVTVPASSDGTVSDFSAATTTFRVYNGATDDTANWTITATPGTGVSGTASGTPANSTYTLTGLAQDSGTVTFTASRSGYSSLTSTFTVVKARAGVTGTNAAYVVVNSIEGQAFKFASGASIPSNGNTLTFAAVLNGGLSAYQWQYYSSGTWTNFASATNNTFSLAHDNAAWGNNNTLNIRCLSGSQSDEVTVVKLFDGTNGSPGSNGTNTFTIGLYNKNTSSVTAPAAFTGTFSYTFSSNTLTGGTLNGWSRTPPSITNGEYLWSRYAVASSTTDTDSSILATEFSAAVVESIGGINGSPGSNGTNTFTIALHNKNTSSVTAPAAFTGPFTYTFSSNTLTGGTLNGWSRTPPSITNGEYLWSRYAVASSTTDADTVADTDFSAAVVQSIGGINGSPGISAVSGYLTNEAHTLPADNAGNVLTGSYTAAGGTFKVFNGITDVTTNSTFSIVGTPVGITANIGSATGVYTLSAMTVDVTTVIFRAVYGTATIDKVYSISKSKTGSSGQRGSVSFDISTTQTTWNTALETQINTYYENNYSSTKVLNDRVTAYNTTAGFSQTRYWAGSWIQAASVVDGNLIVTGTVTGDKLVANTITTNKLLVTGQGAALNNDPNTQDITAWTSSGLGTAPSFSIQTLTDGVVGDKALRGTGGVHVLSRAIPVDATKKYRVRCRARRNTDALGTFYLRLYQYDAAGAQLEFVAGFEGLALTTGWQTFSSSAITLNSSTVSAKVAVVLNWNTATGYMETQDLRCEQVIGGDLIVDGSLTADKIDSRGLSIKRPDGSIILQAGSSGSVLDYSNVGGSSRPADNATRNVIYRQTTAPSGGTYTTGDLWIDTDSSPTAAYQWDGSSWAVISNLTTNTNQLTDGANLGQTAVWNSVTGTGKPADNANNTYVDANGAIQGVSNGAGTGIANNQISISSTGALINAGGGQITTLTASDTRNTNQPPSWYSVGVTEEFKTRTAIGAPGISTYGILRTEKPWTDASGGAVIQTFKTQESEYKRTSVSGNHSQWNAWTPKIDQKIDPANIERFMEPNSIDSTYIGNNLESTNYVANTSGWKIVKNTGAAEFSNVLVRGTVYANDGYFKGNITGATGTFEGNIKAGSLNLDEASGSTTRYYANASITVPTGITNLKATLVGGGGGGASGTNGAGGGGGGGTRTINISVVAGQIITLVVGAGGAVGVNGSATTLTYGSTYTAGGGSAGSGLSGGAGGTGTTSGFAGANGSAQVTGVDSYNNTYLVSPSVYGNGGNSGDNWGEGGQSGTGNSTTSSGTGTAGSVYGGGGGGNAAGAAGFAIIEFISVGVRFGTLANSAGTKTVPVNTIIDGTTKAWIRFDGDVTGGSVKDSFNISSISNVNIGIWTINFTNAMPDTNYALVGSAGGRSNHHSRAVSIAWNVAPTATAVTIHTGMTGGVGTVGMAENSSYTCIAILS